MGARIDYKNIFKNVLYFYATSSIILIILAITTFVILKNVSEQYSTLQTVFYFGSYVLQHFIAATVLMTYVILIFRLYKRVDTLKSLLRLY